MITNNATFCTYSFEIRVGLLPRSQSLSELARLIHLIKLSNWLTHFLYPLFSPPQLLQKLTLSSKTPLFFDQLIQPFELV